jgi:histone deacetylase 8
VGTAHLYGSASGETLFTLCLSSSIQCGAPLALDTPIPTHAAFPMYAPSFTLDVPAGNVRDENSDDYLTEVESIFEHVAEMLRAQLA